MLKWLIAVFAAVFVIGLLQPKLARWLRLGHRPGDVRLRWRGREYPFPFASTLLLSLLIATVSSFL
jgi:hypothetical protein